MKFSDWIILFLAIFITFAGIIFWGINQNRNSTVVNEEYANMLTIACEDTMKTADLSKIKTGVWPSENNRQSAVSAFYATLAYCMNNEYMAEEGHNHLFIPSVVLIDVDGYYISYNSALDDKGNVYIATGTSKDEYSKWMDAADRSIDTLIVDKSAYKEGVTISPINTWTQVYGDYTVRFFLNDEIEVLFKDNDGKTRILKDQRPNLDKEFKRLVKENKIDDLSLDGEAPNRTNDKCSFRNLLTDDKKYEQEKNYVIVSQINNEVEYYINYHNAYAEDMDIPYSYTMPDIKGEDWHRLLKNPSTIAFMQGRQLRTGKQFTNVYALSGGELIKQHQYFITREADGSLLYHSLYAKNCPYYEITCDAINRTVKFEGGQFGYSGTGEYTENNNYQIWYRTSKTTGIKVPISDYGDTEETIYSSMEECARHGAYPCECAKNHNIID